MLSRSAINTKPFLDPFMVPGTVIRTFSVSFFDLYSLGDMWHHIPWFPDGKSDMHAKWLAIWLTFLVAVIKEQKKLFKEGRVCFGSQFERIQSSQWWEHESADHSASKVWKEREMHAGIALTFCFIICLASQPMDGAAHIVCVCVGGFPLQLNLYGTPSQAHPEVYLLGDSKSSQADNEDHPSLCPRPHSL